MFTTDPRSLFSLIIARIDTVNRLNLCFSTWRTK